MSIIKYYYEKSIKPSLIVDTFREAYNMELDYEIFKWRFLNNPANGKVYISYIEINGVLAAFYAVSPVNFKINRKNHKMALSCMTMTHPEHQGKGYFKMLANGLYSKLKEDGFIGIFGFANKNSHYGFRKNLGWVDLSSLNKFYVDKNEFNNYLKDSSKRFSFIDNAINATNIEHAGTLECTNLCITPDRSADFLKWRLLENPTHKYYALEIIIDHVLKGILFYKFYNGAIDIMEYYYNKENEPSVILNGISYLIEKFNCDINIWSNLHGNEHIILEKAGFKENHFLTYFGVVPFSSNSRILKFRNWHFRFLDSDVF